MISIHDINIQFNGKTILENISFFINRKDRIGLVGKNGSGKTTLFRILIGQLQADSGSVSHSPDIRFGYLPQYIPVEDKHSLFEEVLTAFDDILYIENHLKKLNHQLTKRTDYNSVEYISILNEINEGNEQLKFLGKDNIEARTEQALTGLGFKRCDFGRHTNEFSGGWRMRIELAKILLRTTDILLLDEPTNHLDLESIQWFENYLKEYNGAVMIISHDIAFLNNVTNRTIEISLHKIFDYDFPYSKYIEFRKERKEHQLAAYKNQQKQIEDTTRFIERFRYKNTKASQVQSRIKQLERMKKIEIDQEDTMSIMIKFPPAPHSGTIVIEMEDIVKKYNDHLVLNKIGLAVRRGEKIAFIGRNGEGKTTLLKIITGETEYHGKIKLGHNVKIGYFAQNQDELLNNEKTVYEIVDEAAAGDVRLQMRDILGAFLFRSDDIDKKVKFLSGGERSRLAIAKLLLESYNFLILDEPTNHLDIYSKEILKSALTEYKGTLIIVSHDREFLHGLTDRLFEFRDTKIKEYRYDINEYLEIKKINSLQELNKNNVQTNRIYTKGSSYKKQEYLERKELDKHIRKSENQLGKIEKLIDTYEKELSEMNQIFECLNNDQVNHDDIFRKYNNLERLLEEEMKNWEKVSEEIEQLKNKRNLYF